MIKLNDEATLNLEILPWNKAHKLLKTINPQLIKLMEAYDNDDLVFYKASYKFGNKVFCDGKCYLPLTNGQEIELNSTNFPQDWYDDLLYDINKEDPLCIILTRESELYLETGARVMSHAIVKPGHIFGIPRAIDPIEVQDPSRSSLSWNMNMGARSVFFLSKISAKTKHEKLCKNIRIKSNAPENIEDEWQVFKEIILKLEHGWSGEVLYFSRKFVERLKQAEYFQLANYLMVLHRSTYNIWHNTALIWNTIFSQIEQKKHLTHYSMYSIFTARQLFLIAANSAVGFKPIVNENSIPATILKQVYEEYFGFLDAKQSDCMMQPANLTDEDGDAVYYSVNIPMLAEYTPDTFKGKSLISLLEEVRYIVKIYQETIMHEHAQVESLYKVAKTTEFTFYHAGKSDDFIYKDIFAIDELIKIDQRFLNAGNKMFADTASFFKGCIRISKKILF